MKKKPTPSVEKMYQQLVKEVEYSKAQIAAGKCKRMSIKTLIKILNKKTNNGKKRN
jgi:hypothetical protein